MLIYLLFILLFPARAAFDPDGLCYRVGSEAAHAAIDDYLAGLNGTTFSGKRDESVKYKILTSSIDRSPAKQSALAFGGPGDVPLPWSKVPHNVEVVNEAGDIVAYANVEVGTEFIRLGAIQVRRADRDNGIGTEILRPLAAKLPPSTPLRFLSGEAQTNDYFDLVIGRARNSRQYTEAVMRGGRRGGDAFLSRVLTQHVSENPTSTVWLGVLRKSGFQKIVVDVTSASSATNAQHIYYIWAEP